jgi:hypothetical protein
MGSPRGISIRLPLPVIETPCLPYGLKKTSLKLEPWINAWHMVQAWYFWDWLCAGPIGGCDGTLLIAKV